MGIISVENTDRLYWLGRYSERVYTTIKLFAASFDSMIDIDEPDMDETEIPVPIQDSLSQNPSEKQRQNQSLNSDRNSAFPEHNSSFPHIFEDFCKRLEIPNIYTSGPDFVSRYCFDPEDPNSIYSNLTRAYDNCVVLREEIGSETISYIQLAMYEMNKARISPSPLIELQKVLDDILAFWGIVDDDIDSENVRNIIKVGKRIERLDLYARLHMSREEMKREVDRLSGRIWRTCLKYRQSYLDDLNALVEAPKIDYPAIVQKTEMLLEE